MILLNLGNRLTNNHDCSDFFNSYLRSKCPIFLSMQTRRMLHSANTPINQHILTSPSGSSLILPGGTPVPGTPAMPASPAVVQGLVVGELAPSAPLLTTTLRRKMEQAPPHCEACEVKGGDAHE